MEEGPFKSSDPSPGRHKRSQACTLDPLPAWLSASAHFAHWLLESSHRLSPRREGRRTQAHLYLSRAWAHLVTRGPGRTLTWITLAPRTRITSGPQRSGARPRLGPLLPAPLRPLWRRLCAAAAPHAGPSGQQGVQPSYPVCLERDGCWEHLHSISRSLWVPSDPSRPVASAHWPRSPRRSPLLSLWLGNSRRGAGIHPKQKTSFSPCRWLWGTAGGETNLRVRFPFLPAAEVGKVVPSPHHPHKKFWKLNFLFILFYFKWHMKRRQLIFSLQVNKNEKN